jgi:DNA-binding HxlR family transcriptional regulator
MIGSPAVPVVPPVTVAEVRRRVRGSSVSMVLDLIGDRSTMRALQQVFAGATRFDQLQETTGVARNTLADRLGELVRQGVLVRRPYQSNPPRHEYLLTDKGRDLAPVILYIDAWERRWAGDMAGPLLVHATCGHPLEADMACAHCNGVIQARDMAYRDQPPPPPRGTARRQRQRRARGLGVAEDGTSMNVADILGDWWTAHVVSLVLFGLHRFSDMQEAIGIAPNILASRLAHLTAAGVFQRRAYQDRPPRYEYRFTTKGMDLYHLTLAQMVWGDRWMAPRAAPSVALVHRPCGHAFNPRIVCRACGEEVRPEDVRTEGRRPWGAAHLPQVTAGAATGRL